MLSMKSWFTYLFIYLFIFGLSASVFNFLNRRLIFNISQLSNFTEHYVDMLSLVVSLVSVVSYKKIRVTTHQLSKIVSHLPSFKLQAVSNLFENPGKERKTSERASVTKR